MAKSTDVCEDQQLFQDVSKQIVGKLINRCVQFTAPLIVVKRHARISSF